LTPAVDLILRWIRLFVSRDGTSSCTVVRFDFVHGLGGGASARRTAGPGLCLLGPWATRWRFDRRSAALRPLPGGASTATRRRCGCPLRGSAISPWLRLLSLAFRIVGQPSWLFRGPACMVGPAHVPGRHRSESAHVMVVPRAGLHGWSGPRSGQASV